MTESYDYVDSILPQLSAYFNQNIGEETKFKMELIDTIVSFSSEDLRPTG